MPGRSAKLRQALQRVSVCHRPRPESYRSCIGLRHEACQMSEVLDPDLEVRKRALFHQLFVHVSFESQPLHIHIMTQRDAPFAPFVGNVVGILHRTKRAEDHLVLLHEEFASKGQVLDAPRCQTGHRRSGGHPPPGHGVINPFSRRGGHDAGGVSG